MFSSLANWFRGPPPKLALSSDRTNLEHQQSAHLLASETLDAAHLLSQHPPKIEHAKKQLLFELALARGLAGNVVVRRYSEIPLPVTYRPYFPATEIVARKGFFRYSVDETANDWFMNFAHHDLFSGYGNFMFAQDEIQVAEHPVLASVRELMLCRSDALRPRTIENGVPTPVLISGAQRWLEIDSRAIYGAKFARSEPEMIRESARSLVPPTLSQILAIEAPVSSGNAHYTRSEILLALRTAYSGFRAAILADAAESPSFRPTVIHTGNWGCGAYGGNRQLMLSVQMLAARLAGIARIIFYCGPSSTEDVAKFDAALTNRFKFRPNVRLDNVIDRLAGAAFIWGRPDGN